MAKVKIPKRVGGVKIPKKVRRKAKKVIAMTGSPAIHEFAAAALGAAASRGAGRPPRPPMPPKPPRPARPERPARPPRPFVEIEGGRFADDLKVAALDGLRRFLEGFEEGLRKAADRNSTSEVIDLDDEERDETAERRWQRATR